MKAAVLYGENDLRYQEVETPHALPGEVVIEVKACGICTTDVKILSGESTPRNLPTILGHEVAGLVHEVGAGVKELTTGQRVAVYPIASCGECFFCRRGRHSLCLHEFGLAHGADGGFAEYVRIPKTLVDLGGILPIKNSLSMELAAMTEPLSCCLSAFRSAGVAKGDWIAIIGAGPMGLLHLLTAEAQGARTIVIDVIPERLDKARELGAEKVIDAGKTDPVQAVRSITEIGADLVIAALGSTEVMEKYLPMVRNAGVFNIFGGAPKGSRLTIDPRWLHYGEIILTGTFGSSLPDFKQALRLISTGKAPVEKIISHRVSLDKLLDAVQQTREHNLLKAVVLI
ncbi:MAG: alcohol dehydrogenase catalytic domain-containing protein [Chloroflexi bacterium]|nr:alcohol dehydrogenase catalytic domain-containing protein [Chloroflexota bacterium]